MVNVLFATIASVVLVSLISLVGLFTLSMNKKFFNKILMGIVAFAAGALLGVAFFDLIPEAVELEKNAIPGVLAGLLLFFFVERFIHWHHCHKGVCDIHPVGTLNLIGDGVHNFLDGAVIAAAYLTDFKLGIVTTIAVVLHEIPQEIGDFAILIKSGYTRTRALAYNFLTALTAVAGAVVTFFAASLVTALTPFLLALAAGGFIYIAVADLFPEINQADKLKSIVLYSALMLVGIGVMYTMGLFLGV